MGVITGRVMDMELEDVIEDDSYDITEENDLNREIECNPSLILEDGIAQIDVFEGNALEGVEGKGNKEVDVVFRFLGESEPNVGVVESQRGSMDFDHVARATYYAIQKEAQTIVLIADQFEEPIKKTIRNAISDDFYVWGFIPRFVEASDGLKIDLVEQISPTNWEELRQEKTPEDRLPRHQGIVFTELSKKIDTDIQRGSTPDGRSGVNDKDIEKKYDTRVHYSVRDHVRKLEADRGQSIPDVDNDFINARIYDPLDTVIEPAIEDYNASYSESLDDGDVLIWVADFDRSEHNEIVEWFLNRRSDAEELLKDFN